MFIALTYKDKLSLQILPRKNRIIKNKLSYCNLRFVFQTLVCFPNSVNILYLKAEYPCSYLLELFINFSVVATVFGFEFGKRYEDIADIAHRQMVCVLFYVYSRRSLSMYLN